MSSLIWNSRNKNKQRRGKETGEERNKQRDRLLTREDKLMITKGEVDGRMGDIDDGD